MYLIHIEGKGCRSMMDIIPSVQTVYEMEQEFAPNLKIKFLPPNDEVESGIILKTPNNTIRRNWTFKNKEEVDKLRKLILYYLKYDKNNSSNQIENEKKNNTDEYYKLIIKSITDEIIQNNILDEIYKLSPEDKQTRSICKRVRSKECNNNYPTNTAIFDRCMKEVNWLCNNAYSDEVSEKLNDISENMRLNIYNNLKQNNLIMDKSQLDNIIAKVSLNNLANKMQNIDINHKNVNETINTILNEQNYLNTNLNLKEGFNQNITNYDLMNKIIGLVIIIMAFLLIIYLISTRKN